MLFNLIMLAVPVVFLCASAILAVKAFEHGKNRKKTVLTQICSFAAVFAFCMVCPIVASAATGDALPLHRVWLTVLHISVPLLQQCPHLAETAVTGTEVFLPLVTLLLPLSVLQVKILRHSVKQSSSLYLVKVSLFTVCSFQFFLSLQDNLSDLSFVKD